MRYSELVAIPSGINPGISPAHQRTMFDLLGAPRNYYGGNDTSITNPQIRRLLITKDVGPFSVTGLGPAVKDLEDILDDVNKTHPDLYAILGTAGMTCARLVRGTKCGSVSNHSWGTAVDIKLNNNLDIRGDRKVQQGLIELAIHFNRYGWYWGAGFGTEDAMHFEVGDKRIRDYYNHRWLTGSDPDAHPSVLSIGDRGPEVELIQHKLIALGYNTKETGYFGEMTQKAVYAYQETIGLESTGTVNTITLNSITTLFNASA